MQTPALTISRRIRSTPFTTRVEATGVKSYTVYNHMLLPTIFASQEEDYRHLKSAVQVWDVACERQVELKGPDALRVAQMMTPRDLRKMKADQCFYAPIVDDRGRMLNDPIIIKRSEDSFWLSIADSDVGYFAKGLAAGRGLNVDVFEPDVFPLAVQGPKSDELITRVFSDDVANLRFFRHRQFKFDGHDFLIARSGWSKQGGFEIYVDDSRIGQRIWDALFEAGADLDVRPGCPNAIERVEAGLLSYGNDITIENTPYESGLEKYCSPDAFEFCIGGDALRKEHEAGPTRQIRGLIIDGDAPPTCRTPWRAEADDGSFAGTTSTAVYSPDLKQNIAIAMIEKSHWAPGTKIHVIAPDKRRAASVASLPFI